MATRLGIVQLTGCSYELAYDLLGQSVENNTSSVRLYGILHVSNNYVSWSSGSASVHTSGLQPIGTYYARGDHTVITRDFTFTHDNNGNFSAGIGASLSTTFVSGNCSGTLTLPRIDRFATMTDAINNPNDESEFWFKFNNPRNLDVTVWLEINPNGTWIAQRRLTNIGTSGTYTWELTQEERDRIGEELPNTNSGIIRIGIASTIGSTTNTSYIDRKITIINANPIFNNFDIGDINPITLALTGSTLNNVINVNGYSNIQATITTTNKAEAIKNATMTKYRFAIGDSSTDISYSDENDVSGTINNASNGTYNMYAIDSRNNSTLVVKQATSIINYDKIYLDKQNCSIVRDNNQVGENAILTLSGTFWNDDFGQVINSITSVTYKLKKSDSSTWITGTTTITPTTSDNTFTFTGQIASDNQDTTWDLDSSYNLEVIVNDELSSASAEFVLNSAVPTMSLDKNGVGIMCAYDSNLGGSLQVDGKIIDGGTLLWTNSSPTSTFASQTITLSSSDYDILEIFFKKTAGENNLISTKTLKSYNADLGYIDECVLFSRKMQYVSDTKYKFLSGSYLTPAMTQITTDNTRSVPIYIVGYKTNLFS